MQVLTLETLLILLVTFNCLSMIYICLEVLKGVWFNFLQLSVLQMEMESMKEENKVLRKVVEQTMKDYYDLQMKFSAIQENNKRKVNPIVSLILISIDFHLYFIYNKTQIPFL